MITNRHSQQGATLIIVLVLLLIIIIVSSLAIRQGLLSLNIATNAQAQQLMNQNSDSALFTVEDADALKVNMTGNGMFGYISTPYNKGKELVFCYKGTNTAFFSLAQASVMKWEDGKTKPTNNELGTDGYCSLSNTNDYTSGRSAVMTQVTVRFIDDASGDVAFVSTVSGTDTLVSKTIAPQRATVTAISLMPTLSTASTEEINACLSTHMSNPSNAIPAGVSASSDSVTGTSFSTSISECLNTLNVPYTTYVTVYDMTQSVTGS
ncbi:pilus assembly protein PilX [Acinetobacter pragensis]|uniref:pilus assembly protein PilX n=1 Tax=Acinetobacter pragensis TaxID=1806892 RepID=UPI00333E65A0